MSKSIRSHHVLLMVFVLVFFSPASARKPYCLVGFSLLKQGFHYTNVTHLRRAVAPLLEPYLRQADANLPRVNSPLCYYEALPLQTLLLRQRPKTLLFSRVFASQAGISLHSGRFYTPLYLVAKFLDFTLFLI